jgi:hypothetical protein
MLRRGLMKNLKPWIQPLIQWLDERFKPWTKTDTDSRVTGTLIDVTRSKRDMIAENAFLRQQLMVLTRQTPRPSLTPKDRRVLVRLASRVHGWKETLFPVAH